MKEFVKIIAFLLIIIFINVGNLVAQTVRNSHGQKALFSILVGKKWGWINEKGAITVNPQFESVGQFSEGLALVRVHDKLGFVDKSGSVVIPPQFDYAKSFSEGLAAVYVNGKWGYINEKGKMVVSAKFEACGSFSEGLAVVQVKSSDLGLIADDIATEKTDSKETKLKFGYIDRRGNFVIQPQFDGVVQGKYSQKAQEGRIVEYILSPSDFSEGLAAILIDQKWGYIDKTGALVIPTQYEGSLYDPRPFKCGLAAVNLKGKWGFIDRTGKMVIHPQFEIVSSFSENFAVVAVRGKAGYINKKGQLAIEPKFQDALPFNEGLSGVKVDGKWGYIDTDGNFAIPAKYKGVNSFEPGGLAMFVNSQSDYGYINKLGNVVWRSSHSQK